MLTLEWPQLLWLLPLPILIYFLAPAAKKDSAALLVPFYDRLQQNESQTLAPANSSKIKLLAMTLIWIAAVLACARPMWIGDPINLPASGRDLLLAVDISAVWKPRIWSGKGKPSTAW